MAGLTVQQALQLAFQHLQSGRSVEAEAVCRQVLAQYPQLPEAHYVLGMTFQHKGLLDDAIAAYGRALGFRPELVEAHINRGVALSHCGRPDEAIADFQTAIQLQPDNALAYNNLANALQETGQLDQAVAVLQNALRINPGLATAANNLGNLCRDQGKLDQAIECYRRAMASSPADPMPHSNLLFTLQYHPRYDPQSIFDESRQWALRHAQRFKPLIREHNNDPAPERRLRIGYLSPDFRNHCLSLFTTSLLRRHDHAQFEVFCYSEVFTPDEITERLQGYADHWRSIVGMADEAVAGLIRQDRIDLLIDITMHMYGNRLLVLAQKPAPVQLTWLAYPGTTGLDTIDYRITDPYLDPPGLFDRFYSERSLRLPDTFWCYDPLTATPEVNPLPAFQAGHVTFGCLNNFWKVNEEVLDLWARLLDTHKTSRLLILADPGPHRQLALDRLAVDPQRVEFISKCPRQSFLAHFHRIDIALDTFPYNGHTTTLEGMWMGVPPVSLVGHTVVGRAGLSQLTNIGLLELVGQTKEDYLRIALELAGDLPRLAHLRSTLRQRMLTSPLMDAARFARNMEAAYRHVWRQWCATRH